MCKREQCSVLSLGAAAGREAGLQDSVVCLVLQQCFQGRREGRVSSALCRFPFILWGALEGLLQIIIGNFKERDSGIFMYTFHTL